MTDRRISGWIVGPLLAAPLVVLTAWIAWGAANRSHDVSVRDIAAPPGAPASAAATNVAPGAAAPMPAVPPTPGFGEAPLAPPQQPPLPPATAPASAAASANAPTSPAARAIAAPPTPSSPAASDSRAASAVSGSPAAPQHAATAAVPDPAAAPGFPRPEADLPQDRLEERVDGAAAYLTSIGCRRLVYWRLPSPAADLELLLFETPAGAAKALARDAGPDRTAGPGNEAQVAAQSIYFRRGPAYVRLLADPDVPAAPGALAPIAAKLDAYLAGAAK